MCHLAPQSATYINLATLYSRKAAEDTAKGVQYDLYQQKALETLKEGLDVVGEDAPLLNELGFFHLYQGNVEIAKEYLDRYLAIADEDEKKDHVQKIVDDIDAKLNDDQTLMRSYDAIQMNKEGEAVAILDSFLADNPKVWNAWFLKGWALRRMGNYQQAEKALLAALQTARGQATSITNWPSAAWRPANPSLQRTISILQLIWTAGTSPSYPIWHTST